LLLGLISTGSAHAAKSVCFGTGEHLKTLAETGLKNKDGAVLKIAKKHTTRCFILPYWTTNDGLVLVSDLNRKAYYSFPTKDEVAILQKGGLLPTPLPDDSLDALDMIMGNFLWVVLLIGGGAVLYGKRKSKTPA
jgi:hypothetical protein